jgi:hypothetical protein
MTTLILAGEVIVAAVPTVDVRDDAIVTPDGIFPFAAGVTGTQTVDSLPADFRADRYVWRDGALVRLPDPPAPPAPVPAEVTNFQARAALIGAGLFDQVDTAVRTSGNAVAVQAWDYANTITRNGTLVNAIGAGLGLSAEQLDDLFRAAAVIEA